MGVGDEKEYFEKNDSSHGAYHCETLLYRDTPATRGDQSCSTFVERSDREENTTESIREYSDEDVM